VAKWRSCQHNSSQECPCAFGSVQSVNPDVPPYAALLLTCWACRTASCRDRVSEPQAPEPEVSSILTSYMWIRLLPFSLNTFSVKKTAILHDWLQDRLPVQRAAVSRVHFNIGFVVASSHWRQTIGLPVRCELLALDYCNDGSWGISDLPALKLVHITLSTESGLLWCPGATRSTIRSAFGEKESEIKRVIQLLSPGVTIAFQRNSGVGA
jgi:hypothetical protein